MGEARVRCFPQIFGEADQCQLKTKREDFFFFSEWMEMMLCEVDCSLGNAAPDYTAVVV